MSESAGSVLGVGLLGAGPVTQAIHLPSLAGLTDTFRIASVMDVDMALARSVAERAGARATDSMDDLLADDSVDVVGICSPHQFHAEQVIAACRAGKRAVMCEKPFAMTTAEAVAIAEVSAATEVPIVVGAMHRYDPGWLAAEENWGALRDSAHWIRSSIVLPPNPRFEDFATEVLTRPPGRPVDYSDVDVRAGMVHGGVMGLAIHDLPLIRRFLPWPAEVEVLAADINVPFGYLIVLRSGRLTIELHAVMSENWSPNWLLEVIADDLALSVEFTPSYVQAGSAVAELWSRGNTVQRFGPFGHNGYQSEWLEVATVARGGLPMVGTVDLIDDLTFAIDIADAAAEALRRESALAVRA